MTPAAATDMPSAVLFDMDGTLIDSEHLWLRAEVRVMESLGTDWTTEDQSACLGGPLERVADYMKTRSRSDLPSGEIGRLLLCEIESLMRSEPLEWRPGALDLLGETMSAGIPRALVTASWAVLVDALADRMALDLGGSPFTAIVAGDDVANSKPHPEPYRRAAAAVGASPDTCLALEDSPTGVASAAAAGCRVVAVPHMAPVDDALAGATHKAVVTSLAGWSLADLWRQVS